MNLCQLEFPAESLPCPGGRLRKATKIINGYFFFFFFEFWEFPEYVSEVQTSKAVHLQPVQEIYKGTVEIQRTSLKVTVA